MLRELIVGKRDKAELIVLVDGEQRSLPLDSLSALKDIWVTPLSEEELYFRFQRLQQEWKWRMDAWQTNQYLEATINSVPNLIWYKDKNGIHEKVNDSFCKTVKRPRSR